MTRDLSRPFPPAAGSGLLLTTRNDPEAPRWYPGRPEELARLRTQAERR